VCNCNQQRATYSSPEQSKKGMVKVKLVEGASLIINGDVTGRMYVFRNPDDINWMDKRDAMHIENVKELQVIY
jgi:hypothetical protein